MPDLLQASDAGAACPAGGFVIDPLVPAPTAVITHAHGDHLKPGCGAYYCVDDAVPLLRKRLGEADIRGVPYGEAFRLGDVEVSFHPAGHVLGSSQIRIAADETWVVSGDYKRASDPTCRPFEVVPCDVFVTEATFALPIFRWDPTSAVIDDVVGWWRQNEAAGRPSLLLAYGLGKAQRLLAELARHATKPVWLHGAIVPLVEIYRAAGVEMAATRPVGDTKGKGVFAGELILAPPGWEATPWVRRFGADVSVAMASGFMQVRGNRRRRSLDRGFALSDHADWPALLRTVEDTGAKRILVTHGFVDPLVRWLTERGVAAEPFRTGWAVEERPEAKAEAE